MTYNEKNGRLSDMFTLFVDTVLVLYKISLYLYHN